MKRIVTLLSIIAILFTNIQFVYADEDASIVVESEYSLPEAPQIEGHSAVLIDIDTGAILYSKNANEKMYPASITKIMTALLAVENCALEDTFTFTQDIINALPWDAAKYGYVAGEEVNIRDLLHVLMLRSANEVAIGLGMDIAGTEEEFGKLMTARAKEIGAVNTNFVNATGLHDDNHYTTAYDMALIALEAMENATFSEIWGLANYVVNPTNKSEDVVRIWNRHNMLVDRTVLYYSYAKGGKTGYTDEAGRTLVTYASRDGRNLLCVVMKSGTDSVYSDTRLLFEYGFTEFENVAVKGNESRFGQSSDSFFISRDDMFGDATNLMELSEAYVTIPKNITLDKVGYKLTYLNGRKDEVIATVEYMIGENYLGSTFLKINSSKNEEGVESPYQPEDEQEIKKREELPINIYFVAAIIVGIIILIILIKIIRKTNVKRKVKKARKKLFRSDLH